MAVALREILGQYHLRGAKEKRLARRLDSSYCDAGEVDPFGEGDLFKTLFARSVLENLIPKFNTMAFSEFASFREEALVEYIKTVEKTGPGKTQVWDYKVLLEWVLGSIGIISEKEMLFITDSIWTDGDTPPLNTKQILMTLASPIPEAGGSDKKILNVKDTIKVIRKWKKEGYGITASWGAFDLTTHGHASYLDRVAQLGGRFSKVLVLVESDESVRLTRGDPRRPVIDQKGRAIGVAAMAAVNGVCLLGSPESGEWEEYYRELHIQFSTDKRTIGEKDHRFDTFTEQCKQAGTILLFDDVPRITSATSLVKAITGE